jgi:CheY-like chemotaxis protein
MALTGLVVCSDDSTIQVLRRVLQELGLTVETCATASEAQEKLAHVAFDSIIVDCADEPSVLETLQEARASARNANVLAVALVDQGNDVRQLFALGINFVLYKPLSEERAWSSFRAARSLMKRERRRNKRVTVHAEAALDYANVENVPATLLDLSEEGTALQSERKLPPDCRIYFQFALPGHTSLIRLSGEVVWRDSTGRVGMRFLSVPTTSRRVLRNWLKNCAPSPSGALPQVPRLTTPIAKATAPASGPSQLHPDSGLARLRASPGNRRGQSRHTCRLGADVYRMGTTVPNRCSLTDISVGGCYVEMPSPFPTGTQVEIVVRTQNMKLRTRGVVQSVHPGFGMGVQLHLHSDEDRDQVQSLIRLLAESGENAELGPVGDPWSR